MQNLVFNATTWVLGKRGNIIVTNWKSGYLSSEHGTETRVMRKFNRKYLWENLKRLFMYASFFLGVYVDMCVSVFYGNILFVHFCLCVL